MENITENEKRTLGQKLLEFQKVGLISYGNYLTDQLEQTSATKKAYKKYIEDQLEMKKRKINDIEEKLKR